MEDVTRWSKFFHYLRMRKHARLLRPPSCLKSLNIRPVRVSLPNSRHKAAIDSAEVTRSRRGCPRQGEVTNSRLKAAIARPTGRHRNRDEK